MHTLASKVSIQQQQNRVSSPRYYYKISENKSTCSKLLKYWRILITFLFTQVILTDFFPLEEQPLRTLSPILLYLFTLFFALLNFWITFSVRLFKMPFHEYLNWKVVEGNRFRRWHLTSAITLKPIWTTYGNFNIFYFTLKGGGGNKIVNRGFLKYLMEG